jgi:hypothetical protein
MNGSQTATIIVRCDQRIQSENVTSEYHRERQSDVFTE